jgi:hypothetical protein
MGVNVGNSHRKHRVIEDDQILGYDCQATVCEKSQEVLSTSELTVPTLLQVRSPVVQVLTLWFC